MKKDLKSIDKDILKLIQQRQELTGNSGAEVSDEDLNTFLKSIANKANGKRIGFLGPEASFTHQAALSHFGERNEFMALSSIKSVFESLDSERIHSGIIPIENNQQGNVHETIFSLAEHKCFIVAEIALPIHFMLATHAENLGSIEKIFSKDIAFRQCSKFIEASFPGKKIDLESVESTSKAVLMAKENKTSAAICASVAADLYELPVLFENIEDAMDNVTRFLIIARQKNTESFKEAKSTVLAKINDKPGDLIHFLNDFYESGINLTKIESLPARKGKNFKYWFYVDFEGNEQDENVKQVLKKHRDDLKFLGSYKKTC